MSESVWNVKEYKADMWLPVHLPYTLNIQYIYA